MAHDKDVENKSDILKTDWWSPIHIVLQKPAQNCKVINLPLKINNFKRNL